MENIQKEQIGVLVKLQEIETQSKSMRKTLDGVSAHLAKLDAELQTFHESLENEEIQKGDQQKSLRALEAELKENQSRIKSRQEKLRAVKTNKEYQAFLKEIDDLKKVNAKIEDQILEALEAVDRCDLQIQKQKDEFEILKKEVAQRKKHVIEKAETSRSQLEKLNMDFSETSKNAPPELLQIYKTVKEKKVLGPIIVPVKDAVCRGCNLNIPPQMYNELQRCDSLKFCPHCYRIIYYKEMEID